MTYCSFCKFRPAKGLYCDDRCALARSRDSARVKNQKRYAETTGMMFVDYKELQEIKERVNSKEWVA